MAARWTSGWRPGATTWSDPAARPLYFVLLGWSGERVMTIRDFRHARYAVADADIVALS